MVISNILFLSIQSFYKFPFEVETIQMEQARNQQHHVEILKLQYKTLHFL